MSETTLGIQVRIETQADVAAVQKTTGEIDKLTKGTDDLDASLARLKAKLDAASSSLKDVGTAGEEAGEKLNEGLKEGAESGGGLADMLSSGPMLATAATGAFALGTSIGEKLGEGIAQYFGEGRSLMSIIGLEYDERFDASVQHFREAMRNMTADYDELHKRLNEPPGNALLDWLAEVKAAADGAKGAIDALADANKTGRGDEYAAEDQARKDAVERGELSPEDAAREQANADAQREVNERAFAREQKVDEFNTDAGALEEEKSGLSQQQERARAEAIINEKIDQRKTKEQADLARANKNWRLDVDWDEEGWKETERGMRTKLEKESGFDDLETKDGKENERFQKQQAAIKAKEAEMRKRAQAIEDQDTRDAAADAASWNKADRKIKGIDSKEAAGKEKSESDGASKEAAQAGKDASAAGKEVDASTKGLSTGIKALADAVKTQGTQGKAWAAELSKLASTLNDGASEAELTAIKSAMERISSTSSEAFNAMAKSVESQANSLQTIVSKYDALLRKCESLESKINSMR